MEQIIKKDIVQDMTKSYVDYSMSVICARAIPDVRDGLKPVARRILYAMHQGKMTHGRPHKKASAVVGDTMGSYHPHGDSSIYGAATRMGQTFSLRYPLIDGHGNMGNMDGDDPAAMRYVKMRMSPLAEVMMSDMSKNVVDMVPNYDNSKEEPSVLPSGFPNLLANGAIGIAVGMATSIPSHNLTELCDGFVALLDNPDLTTAQIVADYIPAPDFPTGGALINKSAFTDVYTTGRGKATLQAIYHIEEKGAKKYIVFTELPYQVQKPVLMIKIADLVKDGTIPEIQNIYDESDREGIRFVIETHKSTNEFQVLNKLFQYTNLEKNFKVIMLALDGKNPQVFSLKQMMAHYLAHQDSVLIRKTKTELRKAESKLHLLEGYIKALNNIDAIIALIKKAKGASAAKSELMSVFDFSEAQATAILNLKLQRINALEKESIESDIEKIKNIIIECKKLLENKTLRDISIKAGILAIKKSYGDKRRTKLMDITREKEEKTKVVIPSEEIYVAISEKGAIKAVPVAKVPVQRSKGKGSTLSMGTGDHIKKIIKTNTTDKLNVFTNEGKLYRIDAYTIPKLDKTKKGVPLLSLFQPKGAAEQPLIVTSANTESEYIMFVTKKGIVKKTKLADLTKSNRSGVIAFTPKPDDEIIDIMFVDEDYDILLATHNGIIIRFSSKEVSATNKYGVGVKGIKLKADDYVVSVCKENDFICTVSEKGYAKKSALSEFPKQKRYGAGILAHKLTLKTGLHLVKAFGINEEQLILTNKVHKTIKVASSDVPVTSRVAAGNKIMNTNVAIINVNIV